ncbi:MAG TPA: 50S ribosomal protein L15 [Patescibacteria group bacterium]|nr:50S ribosomal protein L15 [Patescibacteria group bacterium]
MKFNDLDIKKQTAKNRVGRGISAGQGKTSGRGTKGQGARAGYSKKPGFAGGSNPLMQKLPKLPGFKSHKPKNELIHLSDLNKLKVQVVDSQSLYEAGLIKNPYSKIKLLSKGTVTNKLTVKLPNASQNAIAALESVGGSFEKTERMKRQTKIKTKTK